MGGIHWVAPERGYTSLCRGGRSRCRWVSATPADVGAAHHGRSGPRIRSTGYTPVRPNTRRERKVLGGLEGADRRSVSRAGSNPRPDPRSECPDANPASSDRWVASLLLRERRASGLQHGRPLPAGGRRAGKPRPASAFRASRRGSAIRERPCSGPRSFVGREVGEAPGCPGDPRARREGNVRRADTPSGGYPVGRNRGTAVASPGLPPGRRTACGTAAKPESDLPAPGNGIWEWERAGRRRPIRRSERRAWSHARPRWRSGNPGPSGRPLGGPGSNPAPGGFGRRETAAGKALVGRRIRSVPGNGVNGP